MNTTPAAVALLALHLALAGCSSGTERRAPSLTAEQVAAAESLVVTAERAGAIREWNRPATVVIGNAFYLLEYRQKQNVCWALDVVRQRRGLQSSYVLRDVMTNREVGIYATGRLDWKQ